MTLPDDSHDEDQAGGEPGIAVGIAEPKLKEPPRFSVLLHNDDYTTMEFVVEILQRFFQKTGEAATQIMLKIHHSGKAVAGIYSFDIAETKVTQVHEYSRSKGFPLKCSIEPAT